MKPYAIISDIHAHKWSTFSKVDPDGVNSRLRIILNEMKRAAAKLLELGGSTMVIAGDVFHARGSIDPEVLNPAQETIRAIMDDGISIEAIPGNHDLLTNDTRALSSSIQTLAETFSAQGSIEIFNQPRLVFGDQPRAFVPWAPTNEALLRQIEELARLAAGGVGEFDLFIHAGIDGVLAGMPDHGLSPAKLAAFGFKRVLAGHYHNHKHLGDGIYSIGATTHQTWSDVDTKAGFLIVDEEVQWHASHAPSFIDVTGKDEDEMELLVPGNYVRYRGGAMKDAEVKELRRFFEECGARGVSIQVVRETVSARPAAPRTGLSLDASVTGYVDTMKDVPASIDRDRIKRLCADVLAKTRSVVEEA